MGGCCLLLNTCVKLIVVGIPFMCQTPTAPNTITRVIFVLLNMSIESLAFSPCACVCVIVADSRHGTCASQCQRLAERNG